MQSGSATNTLILFSYDEIGQLIGETEFSESGGTTTLVEQRDIVWLGNEPLVLHVTTFDSAGAASTRTRAYIHTDQLYTPRVITDAKMSLRIPVAAQCRR